LAVASGPRRDTVAAGAAGCVQRARRRSDHVVLHRGLCLWHAARTRPRGTPA